MRTLQIRNFNEDINLDDYTLIELVIQNKKIFYKYCEYCYNDFPASSCYFNYKVDSKTLDSDKYIHFISHPYCLDLNTKKNINGLYKILKKKYYIDLEEDINILKNKAKEIVSNISLDFDIELSLADDIPVDDLFKIMNLKFNDYESMSLMEQFIKYIKIIYEIQGISVFIIPFLYSYFEENEINEIKKELAYSRIALITLENTRKEINNVADKCLLFDLDLCSIE